MGSRIEAGLIAGLSALLSLEALIDTRPVFTIMWAGVSVLWTLILGIRIAERIAA